MRVGDIVIIEGSSALKGKAAIVQEIKEGQFGRLWVDVERADGVADTFRDTDLRVVKTDGGAPEALMETLAKIAPHDGPVEEIAHLPIEAADHAPDIINKLTGIAEQHPGTAIVELELNTREGKRKLRFGPNLKVDAAEFLVSACKLLYPDIVDIMETQGFAEAARQLDEEGATTLQFGGGMTDLGHIAEFAKNGCPECRCPPNCPCCEPGRCRCSEDEPASPLVSTPGGRLPTTEAGRRYWDRER